MKRWDPTHVFLARTAANVRDRLRLVEWAKLDAETSRVLVWAIRSLNSGLKGRTYRPRESQQQ